MEGELWKRLCSVVEEVGKGFRAKKVQHSNVWIVKVWLYSVLWDRPVSWACRAENWPVKDRLGQLPSPSCMSRRLRTTTVEQLLAAVEARLGCQLNRHLLLKWIDAMPLPVGGSTTDRQAKYGRAAGCKAKGYKVYAIVDPAGRFESWRVAPMNYSEKKMARRLIRDLTGQGYLLGDGEYDANDLYCRAADRGYQLIAPKREGGLGHRHQTRHRLRSIELQEGAFGQWLLASRAGIDRIFGQWGSHACGLKHLPHWVRTLPRVRRYVQAKLIWQYVWLTKQKGLVA
jgi:hypothetical protein